MSGAPPGTGTEAPTNSANVGTLRFAVHGMTCASCVGRVEKVLGKQHGVERVSVNLALHEAVVRGADLDPDTLRSAVGRIGYGLDVVTDGVRGQRSSEDSEAGRLARRNLTVAAVLTIPVFALGMLHVGGTWSHTIQLVLTTIVVFVPGRSFHTAALVRARALTTNMDTLVSLGTVTAWAYSLWALATDRPVYFETSAVIITLILLGRALEHGAKARAGSAIQVLLALKPAVGRLLDGATVREVAIELLLPGDRVEIRPGDRVPVDAEIETGTTSVDESMLTGEPLPRDKEPGDPLLGATMNREGRVVALVTRRATDSALAQIIRLVDQAQSDKAPVQRLADRIALVFVPAVLSIAGVTLGVHLALGHGVAVALEAAVAVIIIACPCALGLATPTAIMVGTGRGAQLGILFKNPEVFETAHRVTSVLFDKTGTLTTGDMVVHRIVADDATVFLRHVGSLEANSNHPIGRAVEAAARAAGIELLPVTDARATPGRGISGTVADTLVQVGKRAFFSAGGLEVPKALDTAAWEAEARGETAFFGAHHSRIQGLITVGDSVREESGTAVAALLRQGTTVGVVSGDNRAAVERLASTLGITEVVAEALPSDKAEAVRARRARGEVVAFVGDGINDAPALAEADLGIALGAGTDVAVAAGAVVLMRNDPRQVVSALGLARRTFAIIRQNLFWAFAYNVAAIPLAALGLLSPMLAALAMALSSVSVVSNSLRLWRFRAT